jgi:2-haloacid dehalogenase
MTTPPAVDFANVEVLTFDCYGTLVDWEAGLLAGMRAVLGEAAADTPDDTLLEGYAAAEAEAERGPWIPYRRVLTVALTGICRAVGVEPTPQQASEFADSVGEWPPFADSAAALERLATRFELGVITNCDDDLFARSHERLGRPFRWVVTAEQVQAYKPARRGFEVALERIGRPRERILHVAQSLYHDHVPAQALGLATAWINRRQGRAGAGATPPAEAAPNLTVPDMASFADVALADGGR